MQFRKHYSAMRVAGKTDQTFEDFRRVAIGVWQAARKRMATTRSVTHEQFRREYSYRLHKAMAARNTI